MDPEGSIGKEKEKRRAEGRKERGKEQEEEAS